MLKEGQDMTRGIGLGGKVSCGGWAHAQTGSLICHDVSEPYRLNVVVTYSIFLPH